MQPARSIPGKNTLVFEVLTVYVQTQSPCCGLLDQMLNSQTFKLFSLDFWIQMITVGEVFPPQPLTRFRINVSSLLPQPNRGFVCVPCLQDPGTGTNSPLGQGSRAP